MLQANIDPAKDKTAEYPITSYKDRMSMYGIAGNHRRFGSDYAELIRSQGIKVSRLKFTEGFDLLPGLTFDMNEVICLAHISDTPYLSDNMDEVEKELKEQKSNAGGSRISAFIYTALFIIPDVLRRSLMSLFGRLSEREENKGTILYMLYIILFGEFFYWTGLFLHIFFSSISQEFWFVGLFFLFTFRSWRSRNTGRLCVLERPGGFYQKIHNGADHGGDHLVPSRQRIIRDVKKAGKTILPFFIILNFYFSCFTNLY